MRNSKIMAVLLVVALVLSMLLVACAGPAEKKMTDIKIASSGIGSGSWTNIAAMSSTLAAYSTWLRGTPIPIQSWIDSLRMAKDGRTDIAGTGAEQINAMVKGKDYFAKEQYDGIRWLWPFMNPVTNVVTKVGSPFRTYEDLRGATVGISLPGTATEIRAKAIFQALGFEPKKIVNMAMAEMAAALKDGTVNVLMCPYSIGSPGMVELTTVNDCFFIPMDDATWKKLDALGLGYMRMALPAKTYRLQDSDVLCQAAVGFMAADKGLSDEIVYEVCRCFWDNIDVTTTLNPTVIGECKNATKGMLAMPNLSQVGPCPIHPAAEKYFRDKGMLK